MTTQTELKVPDITCGGCANSIKKALGSAPKVSEVDVNINTKVVTVKHDENLTRNEIIEVLDGVGFHAS